jgi:hypothetical protein
MRLLWSIAANWMSSLSNCTWTRNQRTAAAQAQRRADPVVRSLEQSANTVHQAIACTNLGAQEHQSGQWAAERELRGVVGQEQSVNTVQQAIVRTNLGERERESAQQAVARENPVVQACESAQWAVAQKDPAVEVHESAQ